MLININFRDSRPIYEQVKTALRKLIVSGAMSPDEKLPSVRELAAQLVINPNTIQRAYRELEAEGYIISIPGKGSYANIRSQVDEGRKKELLASLDEIVTELLFLGVTADELDGLVGPNGAGKTTAMKCLAGVLKPESGEVLADGEPVFENPAVKGRIFCIPDEVFHFPQASILDMMRFYRGVYPGFDERRFEQLREVFRLDLKQPMRRFSRGMLKQAAFWLAISIRPELLILDEPVDGLDPVMRRQVWALIMQDVAEYGTTVLISSHNLRELEDVCDRVGIIDRGKMLLERVLSDMQENMTKLQLVLPEGAVLPGELDILHSTGPGRLRTLVIRGRASDVTARLEGLSPIFMEAVPLTLEEIFIYELGGEGHEVRDIIL